MALNEVQQAMCFARCDQIIAALEAEPLWRHGAFRALVRLNFERALHRAQARRVYESQTEVVRVPDADEGRVVPFRRPY
jgi:hypothetical protein